MKKLIIILCVILLSGCAEADAPFITDRLAKVPIEDMPKRWYSPEEARDAGYYVRIERHGGGGYNKDTMLEFLNKIENGQEAYIRTIYYTPVQSTLTERGSYDVDPVIIDFYYDERWFYVTVDNTRDRNVPDEDAKIISLRYNNLVTINGEYNDVYFITDLDEVTDEDYTNSYSEEYDVIFLAAVSNDAEN